MHGDEGLFIDAMQLSVDKQDRIPSYQEIRRNRRHLIAEDSSAYDGTIFISHRWDGVNHPDPTGWQLDALSRLHREIFKPRRQKTRIWFDYMSLPQGERTMEETAIFKQGLRNMSSICRKYPAILLVSRNKVRAKASVENLIETSLSRGWILTEILTAVRRRQLQSIVVEGAGPVPRFAEDDTIRHLVEFSYKALLSIPYDSVSDIYNWFISNRIECTNGSDLEYLAFLLHKDLYYPDAPTDRIPSEQILPGTELKVDRLELVPYCIDDHGLSPIYPELFFECRAISPVRDHVIIYRRPAIRRAGASQLLTKDEVSALRIDSITMRSPMCPGRIFEVRPVSSAEFLLVTTKVG